MLLEDEAVDDISASIDFTLSPSFTAPQDQQYAMNQSQLLGDVAAEGSLYAPPHLYNPEQQAAPVLKEDCLAAAAPYNIRLRNSPAACALADPMIGSYLSSSNVTAPFSFDSSWLVYTGGSGLVLGSEFPHQEMESQGDNGGFLFPDSLARAFNCSTGDLQVLFMPMHVDIV